MLKSKKKNIAVHLFIGYIFLIVLFVSFSVISFNEMNTLSKLTRTLYEHPLVVSNASLHAALGVTKMHRSMKDVALLNSLMEINKVINEVNEQELNVLENLEVINNHILGEEGKSFDGTDS